MQHQHSRSEHRMPPHQHRDNPMVFYCVQEHGLMRRFVLFAHTDIVHIRRIYRI